ncbi:MAG: N-acetylmuramoyl-L-alanine amidase [Firmicutes bacterium]|nr:N-acetylmuramoyl-L-alanine amidase [Bacillota bacterium]
MRRLVSKRLVMVFVVGVLLLGMAMAAQARGGLTGTKIVIDPGHGNWDPGAVGPTGLMEKDVNWRVGTALRNILVEWGGATVKLTRDGDVYDVDLWQRADIANQWGAGRFISIHHNASVNPWVNGTEVYAHPYGGWADFNLRDNVQASLVQGMGLPDWGGKTANFAVLRYTTMPAILTEASFISNPAEEARLRDKGYTWREAYYIYRGLAWHYGVNP